MDGPEVVAEIDSRLSTEVIEEYFTQDEQMRVASLADRRTNTQKFKNSAAFRRLVAKAGQLAESEPEGSMFAAMMVGVRFGYWLASRRTN